MVWAPRFQAFRTVGLAQALQIDRRLGREQLQHLALERGIAEREARQIGAIDGIHGQPVGVSAPVEAGAALECADLRAKREPPHDSSRNSRARLQGLAAAAHDLAAGQYRSCFPVHNLALIRRSDQS